jgi:hypothetical protein
VRAQHLGLAENVKKIALLVVLGYGISISNSVGVLSGLLLKRTGTFARTPKYAITRSKDEWKGKKYQIHFERTTLLEGTAVFLGAAAVAWAAIDGNFGIIPLLMVYLISYAVVLFLTLRHSFYSGNFGGTTVLSPAFAMTADPTPPSGDTIQPGGAQPADGNLHDL